VPRTRTTRAPVGWALGLLMFRVITIVSSLLIIVCAYIHGELGGLIIGYHKDGSIWYSNELKSSGGDDSSFILIGFYSFFISLVIYFLFKNAKKYFYYVNLFFVYFVMILVDLDVPLINSIKHGDYVLAILMLLIHVPAFYQLGSSFHELKEIGKNRY